MPKPLPVDALPKYDISSGHDHGVSDCPFPYGNEVYRLLRSVVEAERWWLLAIAQNDLEWLGEPQLPSAEDIAQMVEFTRYFGYSLYDGANLHVRTMEIFNTQLAAATLWAKGYPLREHFVEQLRMLVHCALANYTDCTNNPGTFLKSAPN